MNKLARQVLKDLYHPLPRNVEFIEGRLDGVTFRPSIEWPVDSALTAADEVAVNEESQMGAKTVSRVGECWYGTYVIRSGDIIIIRSTDKDAVCRWIKNAH